LLDLYFQRLPSECVLIWSFDGLFGNPITYPFTLKA
jgi:hypothetical protein